MPSEPWERRAGHSLRLPGGRGWSGALQVGLVEPTLHIKPGASRPTHPGTGDEGLPLKPERNRRTVHKVNHEKLKPQAHDAFGCGVQMYTVCVLQGPNLTS